MNRAQRRTLERQLRKGRGLAHPVPDSVALRGGPMDGWIVKPDAPALQPDWWDKHIESIARESYEKTRRRFRREQRPTWDELDAARQEHVREIVREDKGAGRYELGERDAAGIQYAEWRTSE